MYGSKGGNAWKSLPILTEGRRFESCHSEKHMLWYVTYVIEGNTNKNYVKGSHYCKPSVKL